jgi:hypothetical protein
MMTIISLSLAIFSFTTSCLSAYFAWAALNQSVIPTWAKGPTPFEPLDPTQSNSGWISGMLEAGTKASSMNKKAIALAIACAIASLVGGVLSFFAGT